MCIAAAGKVTDVNGKKAIVSYGSQSRVAMIGDVIPKIGDYVLVQMGIVIQKLDKDEAERVTDGWGITTG